jgi:hypothetical protein
MSWRKSTSSPSRITICADTEDYRTHTNGVARAWMFGRDGSLAHSGGCRSAKSSSFWVVTVEGLVVRGQRLSR